MTTVVPCSTSSISLIPGTPFRLKKNNNLTRCNLLRKSSKHVISSQRHVLPLLTSVGLFPHYRRDCNWLHRSIVYGVSATGTDTDVVIEEPESPVTDENSGGASDIPADAAETSENSSIKSDSNRAPAQTKRSRPGRKSEMPPVTNEELIPGATFTGKVRSIQPFGAFVDFGAFTDGLVHVSRLSDNFVKDVGNVVSVGQEVTVRLVEANTETGRISLTMRESDDTNKSQQQRDAPATASSGKPRPGRRNAPKSGQRREDNKISKFVKGQELEGTVKNLTRSGTFISLPEGEEGFLPTSEESDGGLESMMGGSSLEVGQEVSVRVLRISRGQVTLTMKKEEDNKLNTELLQGVVHAATNPFVLAFRKNRDISSFLEEREKMEKVANQPVEPKIPVEVGEQEKQTETVSDILEVQGQPSSSNEGSDSVTSTVAETLVDETSPKEVAEEPSIAGDDEVPGSIESSSPQSVEAAVQTVEKEAEESSGTPDPIGSVSTADNITEQTPLTDEMGSDGKSGPYGEISSEVSTPVSPAAEEVVENQLGESITNEELQTPIAENEISSIAPVEDEGTGATSPDENGSITGSGEQADVPSLQEATEVNCETDFVSRGEIFKELVDDIAMQVAACPQVKYLVTEDVPEEIVNKEKEIEMQKEDLLSKPEQIRSKIVEGRIRKRLEELALLEQPYIKNDKIVVKDWVKQTIATIGENIKVKRFIRFNLGEGLEKKSQDFAAEVAAQTTAKPVAAPAKEQSVSAEAEEPVEKPPVVAVSAALVKQLREETGAGMMDCKKALSETGGDLEKAQEYLRKKGLSAADKKSSRLAAEGRIGSYIHDSRIGVLIEVNCETDFVGRSEKFKELVDDLAMQVVACPQVQFVSTEEIPESILNKEKELEMQREDLASKPENIREKIVEGRISKRLGELALLEQPFIKDDSVLVKDLVKQTVAAIGENIKVRRFVRFTIGENTEDAKTETETEA
ncbi:elongation factor ts, putative [Ricinus communis]|uniref:Elongation factor Ts, mitochondrial n=1 Tax=Ricinus communis TaxID=3988 RepID=B9RKL9_RICCO|nr:elongation factor ts, putative [Ricinus communis]